MFERFTESAVVTLLLSQCAARLLGHHQSEPEDLLLGLVADSRGVAGAVLRNEGLTKNRIFSTTVELFGLIDTGSTLPLVISRERFLGDEQIDPIELAHCLQEIEIPFAPATKAALEAAWGKAASQRINLVDTEHLLLGLLSLNATRVLQILTTCELEPSELSKRIELELQERTRRAH